MAIDRVKLEEIFRRLGVALAQPTTLCLFGSSPGILLGQPSRQTQDVDVWHPTSSYDAGDLARACEDVGVLYDPTGDLDPDAVYIQIVRPGVVLLPRGFEPEVIARYEKLTVAMPTPAALTAAKLVRGSERDVSDIAWWVTQRRLEMRQIERMIKLIPDRRHQETARENLIFVELICGSGG